MRDGLKFKQVQTPVESLINFWKGVLFWSALAICGLVFAMSVTEIIDPGWAERGAAERQAANEAEESASPEPADRSPSAETSVAAAYKVCKLMDATGLASKKCSVSGWSSSVDVSIDMVSSEARDLCSKISGYLPSKGIVFSSGWQIRIYSPYSGGQPIATCQLG